MSKADAISLSAEATSSACARLSSWHGPAMIEIGRSLPNLTDPAATSGAGEVFAFKALSFSAADHAGQGRQDQPSLGTSSIWVASADIRRASQGRLLHRRECGRHQQLIDDVADDLAVRLGLRTRLDPFGIALECGPFLFAVGERFPRQEIGQLLVGFADQRRKKSGLSDAVLLPDLQGDGLEPLQERRQPARNTAIDTHFVNHRLHSLIYCSCRIRRDLSRQSTRSSKLVDSRHQTSRDCTTAASMKDANSGCGSNGRDFSSGWNCTPMNHGWSSYSTISRSTPSGERPEKRRPCCSSRSL